MFNKKSVVLIILIFFSIIITIGSVSAMDNSSDSDNFVAVDEYDSGKLASVENSNSENLSASEESSNQDILSVSENSSEILSLNVNSSNEVLSSSVSVSSDDKPHTYKINGYTFKVSASQYKKIKNAISAGKKGDWLDNGFTFKVKTNKVIKVKVLVSKKTYTKKVRYEGLTKWPYKSIKLTNLKNYYKKGWKKTFYSYEVAKHSKKYLGYNYAILKKTVKKYKTVKMRVYAKVTYQGWSKYGGGPHYYYPWVDFNAMKSGYSTRYLGMSGITK